MESKLLKAKDLMLDNLKALLERGEKIEKLQEKTAEINIDAKNFYE